MLPVAEQWYERRQIEPGIYLITEPHVDAVFRANMWFVKGRDRDLLVDGGMGVIPLRPTLVDLIDKPILAIASHTHLDHVGALYEFPDRAVHPAEATLLAEPRGASLFSADLGQGLPDILERAGYWPLRQMLIEALPHAGYEPRSYQLQPAPAQLMLEHDDLVDTGDRHWRVLHLPGHAPGQIGLFDAADGTLIAGDAIYDGPLIYEGLGTSVPDYVATLRLLASLPVRIVHGGHEGSFGPVRMQEIIRRYLTLWNAA